MSDMPSFVGNIKNLNLISRESYSDQADKASIEMAMTRCRI